jgi:hypothetical protein
MHLEYKALKFGASGGFLGGKFDEAKLTEQLNELAAQRWELVTAFATHQGYGQTRDIVVLFKREKR